MPSRFLYFSIACREYHRIRCLSFARSRDSDIKNVSQHLQSPPELGATACQSWCFSSKSIVFCPISIGFRAENVSQTNGNHWKSMENQRNTMRNNWDLIKTNGNHWKSMESNERWARAGGSPYGVTGSGDVSPTPQ